MYLKTELNDAGPKWKKQYDSFMESLTCKSSSDPIPNLVELTEKEFAHSAFFYYSPQAVGFHTMNKEALTKAGISFKDEKFMYINVQMKLYLLHDFTGYAIGVIDDKVRYFKFGFCLHEYRTPTEEEIRKGTYPRPRMCLSVYVCTKCDYVQVIDSSD